MSILGIQEKRPDQLALEAAIAKQANTILVASAISILFCCLGGLVATYIAYGAKQDALAGDIDSASRRIKFATGWMIATYVLGVMGILGKLAEQSQ